VSTTTAGGRSTAIDEASPPVAASGNGRAGAPPDAPPGPDRPRRRRAIAVGAFLVLVVGAVAAWRFIPWGSTVSTDDAFIAANVSPVSARVEGRVERVLVTDNQLVNAGDVLVVLDPRDLQARVDQARAALEVATSARAAADTNVEWTKGSVNAAVTEAQAQIESAQALIAQARAEVEALRSQADLAGAELARTRELQQQAAVTNQELLRAQAAAATATSNLVAAQRRVSAATAEAATAQARLVSARADLQRIDVARAQAQQAAAAADRARAELHAAELSLSYATITAPIAGRVTSRSVEPGQWARAGSSLLALVPRDVYILANFKETQLGHIRPGQPARVRIDAYPAETFPAHVDSIQAGSGAAFSLLPPENATGNYVKVVQRVPVKIVFDQPPDPERFVLGPGMSVVPRVTVR
jgi:membrane fusion protein (multidrug efflux system)